MRHHSVIASHDICYIYEVEAKGEGTSAQLAESRGAWHGLEVIGDMTLFVWRSAPELSGDLSAGICPSAWWALKEWGRRRRRQPN